MGRSLGFDLSKLLEANGKIKVSKMEDLSSLPQGNIVAYANFAAFPTSPSAGQIAFDTAKDIYYFWNESEWQRIDIGSDNNTAPTLTTTLPSTLELNTDGTTSTLSIAGTDADADNLSYSWDIVQGSNYYSPERNNGLPDQIASIASGYETTGNFVITPSTDTNHGGNFVFRAKASDGIKSVSSSTTVNLQFTVDPGGHLFDATGLHTWTCPSHVDEVSVVCIGGGGGGGQSGSGKPGGGGGGLGWKNNISVTPGQTYNLFVGSGGVSTGTAGTAGTSSYFINNATVSGRGGGGAGSAGGNGGSWTGDDGGAGGTGAPDQTDGGGGGGAGGYTGNGGNGGPNETNGYNGSGGGGGGGSSSESLPYNGGGGVYPYGQGSSGAGGTVNTTTNEFGKGGSGGQGGTNIGANLGHGGRYGGGGGGSDSSYSSARSKGASGCVRIMWGTGRSFPTTNTSLAFSNTGDGESTN